MQQDKSVQILSEITTHMKYARYLPAEQRRETWAEIVTRNKQMHLNKFPELFEEIEQVYQFVYDKKTLPSMRSMQFAGKPIAINNSRGYNCSYLPIDHPDAFSETMWLLLSGTGVGFSVQKQHVKKLPPVLGVVHPEGKQRKKRYLIGDSIEGWADAVKMLVESYFYGKREIDFDFRDIRPKGAQLITSGGKAPGPEPLRQALVMIQSVFENAISERGRGTFLKPIEAHDIQCHLADAVLAGGIRRAAMISGFSFDDTEMITAKSGNWWELNPQRGRANNSAVIIKSKIKKKEFFKFWEHVENSGAGEPGVFFSDDRDGNIFTNPCFTGDTVVPIADGKGTLMSFKEISDSGKDYPVYSLDDDGDMSIRKLKGTQLTRKSAEIYRLTLDNGDTIKATSDHKFRLRDGSWRELKDLEPNDSLWPMEIYHDKIYGKGKNYRRVNNAGRNNFCEHRLIAKELLNGGMELQDAVVHHKDMDTLNNLPENLQIMTKKEHDTLHGQMMVGENNPIHKVLSGEGRKEFVDKLSKNSHGLSNPNSCEVTNEEIREMAVLLTNSVGRPVTKGEWAEFSRNNGIPTITSSYRINELGTTKTLLRWAAVASGVIDKDSAEVHSHTVNSLKYWLERGYDAFIHDGNLMFNLKCEKSGETFATENPYRSYHPRYSRSDVMKFAYSDKEFKLKRTEALRKAHRNRKEGVKVEQVKAFATLKSTLNRIPLKKEWAAFCKTEKISVEIARESSPFRTYDELKDFASAFNHRVVSVAFEGIEDVYDGVVEQTHNFFVSGTKKTFERNSKGEDKKSFVNVANCGEISLRPFQFCNLTTTNVSDVTSQEDLNERVAVAAFIGTLQASYTDFHYLRDIWQETTEKEALLGVSMTGIGSGEVLKYDLTEAAHIAKKVNEDLAERIGIRKAARVTTVKPEGTASLVLGTSSGIHGWWDPYYIRTIRVGKNEAIYSYLQKRVPHLMEDDLFRPDSIAVLSIPQKAPENAIFRHESPIETLERVKKFNTEWVREGHRDGTNFNNVSCTINVKNDEWDVVGEWMWNNRNFYTGIAVLPYDGGTYKQAPFQTSNKEEFESLYKHLREVDLSQVREVTDETKLSAELACAGNNCEVAGSDTAETAFAFDTIAK